MTHSLASARALLAAKSYPAARRAARDLLKNEPDNPWLLAFAVEIEAEAGDHKQALSLCRSALKTAPDNVNLREQEIFTLAELRRKREARDALKRFEQDFPQQRSRIENLRLLVDALYQRTVKLKSKLDEVAETYAADPLTQRDLGMAYSRIGDVFRAQRLMLAAHPSFRDDLELNEALATNSFQLVRPAAARKYATLALATAPERRRMSFLKIASYALYFPPFFLFGQLFVLIQCARSIAGWLLAFCAAVFLFQPLGDLISLCWDCLSVALSLPLYKYEIASYALFFGGYAIATEQDYYDRLFARNKTVKLRKY